MQVYAGRDPSPAARSGSTGRSPGQTRESWKQAKQVEAQLLAEAAVSKHRGSRSTSAAEMVNEWLQWRDANDEPLAPWTRYGYQRLIESSRPPVTGELGVVQPQELGVPPWHHLLTRPGSGRGHLVADAPAKRPGVDLDHPIHSRHMPDQRGNLTAALHLATRDDHPVVDLDLDDAAGDPELAADHVVVHLPADFQVGPQVMRGVVAVASKPVSCERVAAVRERPHTTGVPSSTAAAAPPKLGCGWPASAARPPAARQRRGAGGCRRSGTKAGNRCPTRVGAARSQWCSSW